MNNLYRFRVFIFLLALTIFLLSYFLFWQEKIDTRSIPVFLLAIVLFFLYMLFVDKKIYTYLLRFVLGGGCIILLAIITLPPPSVVGRFRDANNNEVLPIFLTMYFLFSFLLYSIWLHLHYKFNNNLLKTKLILSAFAILTFVYYELIVFSGKLGICSNIEHGLSCFVDFVYLINPLTYISLLFAIIFSMMVFVSNYILRKWVNFFIYWVVLETFLIISFPYDYGGWMSFGPTKDLVSLYMSSLFLVISIIMIIIWTIQEKRKLKK